MEIDQKPYKILYPRKVPIPAVAENEHNIQVFTGLTDSKIVKTKPEKSGSQGTKQSNPDQNDQENSNKIEIGKKVKDFFIDCTAFCTET